MAQNEASKVRQKITGVLLRQARMDAGKTLKECGRVLGVSSGAISAIEHGRRSISLPELEILAYYLGVPLDRLLNGGTKTLRTPVEELPSSELLALRHRIIGAVLRQARLELDLNQNELARSAGMSRRRLSQYELGERPVPLTHLAALAGILEIPMDVFMDEGLGPIG